MHLGLKWFSRGVAAVSIGSVAVLVLAGACNDSDSEPSPEEVQEIEALITELFGATPEDAEFFLGHVTDNLLETVSFTTREECEADATSCIGEPTAVESVADVEIDGDTATANVTAEFGVVELGLVREDDQWKADSLQATSDEVPDGATSVDLGLAEFAFEVDQESIPADGNFAFNVTNNGEQPHEVIVASIPADVPLQEALEATGEGPPAGLKVFIQPDQQVDMAFAAPLAPGRYALVCFFPDVNDPEMTPHAEKGMAAEFTIE
jgi:hypothetical protein